MRITPKQYAVLLYEMTKEVKKSELAEAVESFVKMLMRGRALPMLSRILELYKAYYNAQESVVDVEVTTARKVGPKTLAEIGKQLEATAELRVGEDQALLGGARIKVGDYMIDDTLKARLTRLKMGLSYGR